ncbi:DinB family protein [Paenibacillus sp. AK002]
MNTKEALQRLEETVKVYVQELDGFSEEQLRYKPAEDEWSIGQMYQHLIQSAQYMHLRNIDQCLKMNGDAAASPAGKTEQGAAIFEQGSFPPIRIQVPPSPQYTPEQPESKEQLVQGMNTVLHRMKETEPMLGEASLKHTVSHPRFGGLHAQEWFLLIEMHYRHHIRQLNRLKQALAQRV